ncbi:MAG: hypothetical protein V1739_07365 [Candidatus Omnitrophota bacterium]
MLSSIFKNNAILKTRALDGDFLKSLSSGELKYLLAEIKRDNELCLCFRGTYVNVYYKGGSLFKIQRNSGYCKIIFDFNYARYTKDFTQRLGALQELGFRYFISKDAKHRKIICKYPQENKAGAYFWQESIRLLKGLIDDFSDMEKTDNLFSSNTKRKKKDNLEKQRQQEIMLANSMLDGEYFIYDMEYDQPRNSSKEEKSGRFDMLALRRVTSGCYSLVFIELKSTKEACKGVSGIGKHYNDLKKYISIENIINTRREDAKAICKQYFNLGLIRMGEIIIDKEEILFVFTDEAIKYAQEIKNPLEKCILSSEDLRLKFNNGIL